MRLLPALIAATALAMTPVVSLAGPGHCPPGLAKKNPPCVPPGQAKKGVDYHPGDHFEDDDYVRILYPDRYGLDPRGTYYHRDGYVLRVDPETRKVLNLIGAIADLME
ncbi:excinuclease ABC subunit A [Actibacterium sp. XHP0104]|uniref:excinuclease ABC subunit A n=1 Tax=Actibacterium sp. XHP0104 TaxID=2984335 RepID=UPI0021E88EA9|nr:excinuclease ABC subunit A [Actibacterium sp. XHP0104]MCV2880830.1 excinuclease ABC subunit A [Actibacterium sp. XHP0104]